MDERLTIKQVLMMTRDLLKNIGTIPLEECERIGMPINNAIRNLDVCIEAINEDEKRMAETEKEKAKEEDDGNADAE